MRPEIKLRSRWLAEWQGQVSRIEPTIGSTAGMPDTFLINSETAGWVEFKVVCNGGTFEIRKEQERWHKGFNAYSDNATFCILSPQGWWLIPSIIAVDMACIYGRPVDWGHTTGLMLSSALKNYAYKRTVFNGDVLDDIIEPKVGGIRDGKQGQKVDQGDRSGKRAIAKRAVRS